MYITPFLLTAIINNDVWIIWMAYWCAVMNYDCTSLCPPWCVLQKVEGHSKKVFWCFALEFMPLHFQIASSTSGTVSAAAATAAADSDNEGLIHWQDRSHLNNDVCCGWISCCGQAHVSTSVADIQGWRGGVGRSIILCCCTSDLVSLYYFIAL